MEGLRAIFDKKPSLSTILLTDATKYFCVLFIMNALSAVLTICNTRVNVTSTYIIMLTDVLTTVLLSRMLLNLRRVVHRDVYASAATDTSLSLHFGDAVQSQAIDISLNPVTDEGDHDSGDDDAAPAGAQEEADTSP
ncbi:hypothetical protein DAEQUDRAFT_521340 [Daedalea quercina L-15889]|uniref:Uncharacterized protein n=1 Tax=Daedalea quercina L-15889 TaxID=1314783 RepID=A0A165MCR4_9APHY|nr:hypothetical protein DAEQUDRAFT_521340 [Daedalea quercina L-15889]